MGVLTDVTISRKITINTGDYSSIGPGVSMTLKNINLSDIVNIREAIHPLLNGLFDLEILDLYSKQVKTKGLNAEKIAAKGEERKQIILKRMTELLPEFTVDTIDEGVI